MNKFVLAGIVLVIIAIIGLAYPTNEYGDTVLQQNAYCKSGFVIQISPEFFNYTLQDACNAAYLFSLGIYILIANGIVLISFGILALKQTRKISK